MDQHNEENPLLKPLYTLIFIATGLFLILTYTKDFDSYSETDLVNMSYIWIPALCFSVIGLISIEHKYSLIVALIGAVATIPILFVFYEIVWPLL